MAEALPRMHHVAIAVSAERHDETKRFFGDLGFTFADFELPDVGLHVALDWERGIELLTPTADAAGRESAVAKFLARHGDGLYSAVLRVHDAAAAHEVARRHGSTTLFAQHREVGEFSLDEIELDVRGIPVTVLSTDLP
ncbi:VOC family protein [Mycobacterium conspicuum]|nr:VOC family protein [Mycobacterium conspicuum]